MIYGLLRIINSNEPFKVLDDVYFNKKINCFDTANCYGRSESIFGEWILSRNINRNDIYIICKGGHHLSDGNQIIHRITQQDIIHDLNESFKRLKITYSDSFMFHRDNENIPPEEIYDICNYLLEFKLCKKIGVSNWKTSRIEEVNYISKIRKGTLIIEESQIFLNYIKLSYIPYPNIHMINYIDYIWYLKNPEHKIQIYSVACFISELDNNKNHQNKIFKKLLEYICDITNESKQTILYVLLSKCKGLNVECIQGSISSNHILSQTKIDNIFLIIEEKIPNFIEFIPCFLVDHPIGTPENNMISFLINGFIGPFKLQDIEDEKIDSIVNWLLNKNFNNYTQMKHHHESNFDIKELCLNKTINDIVTKYIGYECICYNTEFFVRENNNDFTYTANWHIDPYINLDDSYPQFTLQIGLTDNNDNNSLSAILGTHLFDYQNKYNLINKNDNFAPLVNFDEKNIDDNLVYKLLNKKGYVYLFSNYLIHGKGIIKNNDNNIRVALTMRIISKESIIKTKNHSHISKDIFTLGTVNNDSECLFTKLIWNIVQKNYKSIFIDSNINEIINKTYTWENSHIKFLDNFKMDAFGEGHYTIIDKQNIIANFGCREHNISFNNIYTEFISIRKDDLQIVNGKLNN
jgi:predicted oxidoreductase/ectoine hydroxylase-related dioxygenase (phytanoyl-CoA dioxygenase family)